MTLHQFLRSDYFQTWLDSRLGNNLFINDPDRADRVQKYAKQGVDGNYAIEYIQDCRDAWKDYCMDHDVSDVDQDAVKQEIDQVEGYHERIGTLWEIVG